MTNNENCKTITVFDGDILLEDGYVTKLTDKCGSLIGYFSNFKKAYEYVMDCQKYYVLEYTSNVKTVGDREVITITRDMNGKQVEQKYYTFDYKVD